MQVLIAGGGIGGLAAALSIARKGHCVKVLERRDDFAELGAGIQLGPNAFLALRRLGVAESVRTQAVFVDELRLVDGTTDGLIVRLPVDRRYRDRFLEPYAVVHRGELYRTLFESCQSARQVELCGGSEVVAYEQDAQCVVAMLQDGGSVAGAAMVGADGIRSKVRAQLVRDGGPRISGHTIYRSVLPMSEVPTDLRSNSVTLWAGPGWHFVQYPIAGGRQLNMAATVDNGAREEIAGVAVDRARVMHFFAEVEGTARRLLELGRDWQTWVLCDRDPVDCWVDGRVALLGDAAHPMLQYAAQGACMALEDAVVLGRCLGGVEGHPGHALQEYNGARRTRTARIQLVSRKLGEVYHASGVEARERNDMLSSLGVDEMHRRIAWLHGARQFDEAV